LGCAHVHIRDAVTLLRRRADVEVRGVWDHDGTRARRWAEELGAICVEEVEQILEDRSVCAVVVMTETDRHPEMVERAASGGKHLFVEKPLAISGAAALQAANVIESSDGLFHTGYFLRQLPALRLLRAKVLHGSLGRIVGLRGHFAHRGATDGLLDDAPWMMGRATAGYGGFGDLGVHLIDLMTWMLDEPVVEVCATLGSLAGEEDLDQYGHGMLRFAGGSVGFISAGWVEFASPITLSVSGTKGHAYVADGELVFAVEPSIHLAIPPSAKSVGAEAALETFIDAVTGKQGVQLVEPRDAARHCQILDALYQAARDGTWVGT